MTDIKLSIVGIVRQGGGFVVKDASNNTYDCKTPEDLWNDVMAITSNKALPGTTISQEEVDSEEDNGALLADACNQVRDMVGENHGMFAGHLAAEMARKVAPFGLKSLRNLSKRDRFGNRKKSGS